ncbi:MAG: sensor histidine kinase [Kiritimatiellia bacterium]
MAGTGAVIAGLLLAVATVATAPQINSGELVDRGVVRFTGVVSSVMRDDTDENYNWMIVRTPQGKACAAVAERIWPIVRLRELCDAEVELTGYVCPMVSWRKFLGCLLVLGSADALRVIRPAPDDPFAGAALKTAAEPHRQTAVGAVLARTSRRFFLRRTDGEFLPVTPLAGVPMPAVGTGIAVAGFADRDNRNLQLVEAVWKPAPEAAEPLEPCAAVGMGTLFWEHGHRMANTSAYGQAICVEGKVVRTEAGGRVFRLADGRETVDVDLSGFGDEVRMPAIGARVEVQGVCYADFESDKSTIVFPRFRGFIVIPRVADDLRIVASAPWWTAERLLVVAAVLLFLVVFFVVWSVLLRRLAAKRARELADERIVSARAELRVAERTRLAVELHDSLSQTLTGVALQIDAAESAQSGGAAPDAFLARARRLLDACRQELRGCLWDLRVRTFDEQDLTEAIVRSVSPQVGTAALTVRFNVPRAELSEEKVHAILKIVRELTSNAMTHGRATHVRVAGERHGDVVTFAVTDDGDGFDPATAPGPQDGHFGLQCVRERLGDFDGALSVESAPGRGTRVVAKLRVKDAVTE